VAYALLGSSRTLSVGPVAITAIMAGSALGAVAEPGSGEYIAAALALTLLSGLMLVAMGLLKLGVLSHLLSHPVVMGFVSAAAILIAFSQLGPLLGISSSGHTLPDRLISLWQDRHNLHGPTLWLGLTLLAVLLLNRWRGAHTLQNLGLSERASLIVTTLMPAVILLAALALIALTSLGEQGIATIGLLPEGLPSLTLPMAETAVWLALIPAAFLISLVGFVESVSMARTLAAKNRERVLPDQELLGLGAANMVAAGTGGMPVTGSFSRSVVNQEAGARTPVAGIIAALFMAISLWLFTPVLAFLPIAALAALIIVAVLTLIEVRALPRLWRYAPEDGLAMASTLIAVLLLGIETGLIVGIALSIVLFIRQTSRPHIAIVGQVPGTEHFRNVERHEVITYPGILQVRVDESLYFANAHQLEDRLEALVAEHPETRDLVLQCNAINYIDGSALESLETIHERLQETGINLHLSEVKGPVMDRLRDTRFLAELSGAVFLSHQQAVNTLRE